MKSNIRDKFETFVSSKSYDEAVKLIDNIDIGKQTDLNLLEKLSLTYNQTGRNELALKAIERIIQLEPNQYHGYFKKGLFLYEKKKYRKAAEIFEFAIRIIGHSFEVLEYLSNCYLDFDPYEAYRTACVIIALDSKKEIGFLLSSRALWKIGDQNGAFDTLESSLAEDERRPRILLQLINFYRQAGLKDKEYHTAKRLNDIYPKNPDFLIPLAKVSCDLKRISEAKNYVLEAETHSINPTPPIIMELKSHIEMAASNREIAVDIACETAKLYPNRLQSQLWAARACFKINQFEKCRDYAESAWRIAPKSMETANMLVEVCILQKDQERALEVVELLPRAKASEINKRKIDIYIKFNNLEMAQIMCSKILIDDFNDDIFKLSVDIATQIGDKEVIKKLKSHLNKVKNQDLLGSLTRSLNFFSGQLLYNQERLSTNNEEIREGSYLSDLQIKEIGKRYGVYTMPHKINSFSLYHDDRITLYLMEGLSHSVRTYTNIYVPDNSFFLILIPHHFDKKDIERQIAFFHEVTGNRFSSDRLVYLTNEEKDVKEVALLGAVNSFFCNQNAWLDFDLFKIRPLQKKYDLVLNTRPEYKFKRPYLAANVNEIAIIRGNLVRQNDYWPLEQLNPKFINSNGRLSQSEVIDILCESYVGGIFSPKEGACYASSEYLLCGLPVVSTNPTGSRGVWYTDDNSILVDPDPKEVAKAVELAKKRIITGEWSSEMIRQKHIDMSLQVRDYFVKQLDKIIKMTGSNGDAKEIFDSTYRHQYKNVEPY